MVDQIPLSLLAGFSSDSRVYSAFGHYIAPGTGRVLLVPTSMAYRGHIEAAVVPGCPVPVNEISALLDTPAVLQTTELAKSAAAWPVLAKVVAAWQVLAAIAEEGWQVDFIPMMPGHRHRVLRVTHDNGVRYGEVMR